MFFDLFLVENRGSSINTLLHDRLPGEETLGDSGFSPNFFRVVSSDELANPENHQVIGIKMTRDGTRPRVGFTRVLDVKRIHHRPLKCHFFQVLLDQVCFNKNFTIIQRKLKICDSTKNCDRVFAKKNRFRVSMRP